MKIAWFCIPAHGHTNPTLNLVKELTSAGHKVFYFSFETRISDSFRSCKGVTEARTFLEERLVH